MVLTKLIQEKYVLGCNCDSHDSPAKKIQKDLKPFSSPHGPHENILVIPSIPGGKVYLLETLNGCKTEEVRADFYYLEGANEDDIAQICNIFYKQKMTLDKKLT